MRSHWPPRGARPEWWPEDQPWPPPESRRPSRRFMLHVALGLALLLLMLGAIAAAGIWAVLTAVGVISASPALRGVAVAILVAGIVCVLLIVRAARRRFAPIAALIDAAERIERGDYSARVPERGGRGLRALGHTFNAMSERLAAVDTERRSFLADVAHELRTPLSIIRGRVEAMIDGVHLRDEQHLRAVLDQAESLERLVGDVATVALAETGSLPLHLEQVDLEVLANAVADDFAEAAHDGGVRLDVRVASGAAPIEADPARLRQALGNLVANALRYSARDGVVEIVVEQGERGTVLSVQDDGAGVPPELAARAFERFVRSPDSPGSGLGLPIVADIAAAHGGSATLDSSPAGTTVSLVLP